MTSVIETLFSFPDTRFQPSHIESLKSAFAEHASPEILTALDQHLHTTRTHQFQTLLYGSEFAGQLLCEHPQWMLQWFENGDIDKKWEKQDYREAFSQDCANEEQWDQFLREQRNQAMCRLIWRDFNRLATMQDTVQELTCMAETALQVSLEYYYPKFCLEFGTPRNKKGTEQPLLILGMGKLGAWELNLSSDIDLIFAYPSSGETTGTPTSISNQEFFTKLCQRLIRSIDQPTGHGFVFRVDMRLRPYGQSGALVSSFSALEEYYQTQGRDWERFAMIKARIVASNADKAAQQTLMTLLRHFTYRGYVDFSAIEALRKLKQLIHREVKKRVGKDNIKLGKGGIREIEFIAQAFQLIRGGKDTQLQERRLLRVLPLLDEAICLPEGVAEQLAESYIFLRNVEHAIQGYQDRQTQDLPQSDKNQQRLAYIMGFPNWPAFHSTLQTHRDRVNFHFNAVIATPDETEDHADMTAWRHHWLVLQEEFDPQEPTLPFENPEQAHSLLQTQFIQTPTFIAMSAMGRERLDDLMPRLLQKIAGRQNPTDILQRLTPILLSVARRSAYLLLLTENPAALEQMVLLSEASPWISTQLADHPALLDELLDTRNLYSVPSKSELTQELRQEVLRIDESDLEAQMETLRYFRSSHALRVAACEVTGRLPLMKVSDYLTELAEVLLEYAVQLAWQQMIAKHGYPSGIVCEQPNFLVIGYGKLGGIELGHESDLDLVFLHDDDPLGNTSAPQDNVKELDNLTFFVRMGQKIIHFLDSRMPSGQLYEVDVRLRPSGNSGLLVSHFSAYEKYQNESAWTWEHQALVRARAICGPTNLIAKFQQLRKAVLTRPRDTIKLAQDVADMRQKMREQLGTNKKQKEEGQFHLKQDAGGIVDIEFMVQYAVLAWSHTHPALTEYTDNIRILERLATSGQFDAQEVHQLIEAYKAYRSQGHRLALQRRPNVVESQSIEAERHLVTQIWQRLINRN